MERLETILERWIKGVASKMPGMFVVGGAVRDHLLGRPPKDVDIVCVDPQEAAQRISENFGGNSVVIRLEKKPHPACFRVINRERPSDSIDVVKMRSEKIEKDLAERDFTINAIAAEIGPTGKVGPLVDPLCGRKDLEARIIRACSNRSLASDPLRILRAARFSAELGFSITDETLEQMKEFSSLLVDTAPERITFELFELLKQGDSFAHILALDRTGALEAIFPEIVAMRDCKQDGYHHLDVWGHCLETLHRCEMFIASPEKVFGDAGQEALDTLLSGNRIPVLKLAALFHDVGKPECSTFDPNKGRHLFHNHQAHGESIAVNIAERMRLSNKDKNFFCLLVGSHARPRELSLPGVKKSTVANWFASVSDDGLAAILLAASDIHAKAGKKAKPTEKERFLAWARKTAEDYLRRIRPALRQKPLVSGRDLLAIGLEPGPQMGRILDAVRHEQYNGIVKSKKEALDLAKRLAGI